MTTDETTGHREDVFDREVDLQDDAIFENDLAKPDLVPVGAPLLTGGSQDAVWVPYLTDVLNRELGAEIPIGDLVTADVLTAVRALRARDEIPAEQGVQQPENYVGPNLWAAISQLQPA